LSLANSYQPYPNKAPPHTFASDASTIKITPNINATNFAVVANGNAFSASISGHGSETGILQGESYGIVVTSLLALHSKLPTATLYSDHLNSVTFLNSQPPPHTLQTKPACSYYRWILHLWQDASDNNQQISLLHSKAHTTDNTLPSQLNRLADHLASHSHYDLLPPSPLPPPTFAMDDFTLYSPSHGFIETNISSFIDSLLSNLSFSSLDTYHAPLIPSSLFDDTPPPSYSYLQALSSFSAVVQLYLRCGQLDTSFSLSHHLSDGTQPWCRFGCYAIEDPHC